MSSIEKDFEWSELSDGNIRVSKYIGGGGDVVVPDYINGKEVTGLAGIAGVFHKVKLELTGLVLPKGVKTIGISEFCGFKNLTKLVLGEGTETIKYASIKQLDSLEEIHIPKNVTKIECNAIVENRSLRRVTVDAANPVYRSEGNCIIERATNAVIMGCNYSVIPDGVTSIHFRAFSDCRELKEMKIPGSVEMINNYAFEFCNNLEKIEFPKSLTTLGDGVFKSTGLKEVFIHKQLTAIGKSSFQDCPNLEKIAIEEGNPKYSSEGNALSDIAEKRLLAATSTTKIPKWVTSFDRSVFSGCGISEVVLRDDLTGVEDSLSFFDCYNLKSVILPKNLTKIPRYAFYGCVNLESIVLPECLKVIEGFSFEGSGIKSIHIPKNVEKIDESAFWKTNNLESITCDANNPNIIADGNCLVLKSGKQSGRLIADCNKSIIPEFVTWIAAYTFLGKKGLESIVIPSSVKGIGADVFRDCVDLTTIELKRTAKDGVTTIEKIPGDENPFELCPKLKAIIVPDADSLKAYKTTKNWRVYAKLMRVAG